MMARSLEPQVCPMATHGHIPRSRVSKRFSEAVRRPLRCTHQEDAFRPHTNVASLLFGGNGSAVAVPTGGISLRRMDFWPLKDARRHRGRQGVALASGCSPMWLPDVICDVILLGMLCGPPTTPPTRELWRSVHQRMEAFEVGGRPADVSYRVAASSARPDSSHCPSASSETAPIWRVTTSAPRIKSKVGMLCTPKRCDRWGARSTFTFTSFIRLAN